MTRVGFSGKGGVSKHSELTDVSTPHALADLASAVCSETEADAKVAAKDIGEGHICILGSSYYTIGQGTWVIAVSVDHPLNFYWFNSSQANGDNCSYKVYLQAGTYSMMVIFYKGPGGGIVDFYINGSEEDSIDMYAAGNTPSNSETTTGITIGSSGLVDVKAQLDGKHGSSGGYAASHSVIILWRTA